MAHSVSTRRRATTARVIEWLPAVTAAAYAVVVVVEFPALVRAVYWDSDAAGAFVLGELIPGDGTIEIPRFGWWTSLWWLLATRRLPGHEHLWEITAYPFALATAAIVGWATARVAGRWAGVTAAAVTVLVGPYAIRFLMVVNIHAPTAFTAAVLGAYLVFVARSRSWIVAVLVGALVGANAASDPLLWIAGVVPFVLAASVLAHAMRARAVAIRAAVMLGACIVTAGATNLAMAHLGFHVIDVGVDLARVGELRPNFASLGRSIALLFGANFSFPPPYPSDPLRYVVMLLAFAGLAALAVAAVRLGMRGAEPTTWAYACYWLTSAVLVSIAFWATNIGSGGPGVKYMLSLAPAAGVGVALLTAGSPRSRIAASLAIAVVGAVNIAGIAHGRAELDLGPSTYGPQLLRLLEQNGLTRGYASYWNAHSLTWKSGMRVLVAPVSTCDRSGALCRDSYFTIDSWYHERPGRSFLIAADLSRPPAQYAPSQVLHTTSGVTVYVYPYDLARHIRADPDPALSE